MDSPNPRFPWALALLCMGMAVCPLVAHAESSKGGTEKPFVYAPEFHFDEHLVEYFNAKDEDFQKRYFLENSTFIEAAFFSINRRYFFFGNVITNFGMGRQPGAILLDPRDVDMAFGPVFEYRNHGKILQAGLDHHCFHQIDVPEWNTLYWNKLYLSVGSDNLRRGSYKENLGQQHPAGWHDRLSWQCTYGYFVHELFGALDTNALSWGHAYVHEVSASARWTFFQSRGYAVFATGQSLARVDRSGAWLWREDIGFEAMNTGGSFGMSLFVNWVAIDRSIIRENRDRLVEIGARVFR